MYDWVQLHRTGQDVPDCVIMLHRLVRLVLHSRAASTAAVPLTCSPDSAGVCMHVVMVRWDH